MIGGDVLCDATQLEGREHKNGYKNFCMQMAERTKHSNLVS